jgi:hypothetical protein
MLLETLGTSPTRSPSYHHLNALHFFAFILCRSHYYIKLDATVLIPKCKPHPRLVLEHYPDLKEIIPLDQVNLVV